MPAELTIDDRAFRQGVVNAVREMRDHDGLDFLRDLSERVLGYARAKAPRGATLGIVDGLDMRGGTDADGPYFDVGVLNPPPRREDFWQEFGTFKDRPQPFMRPALAAIAGGLGLGGGRGRLVRSVRSRGIALRSRKRAAISAALRRGDLSAGAAQVVSRAVSAQFRLRRTRAGQEYIQQTKIRSRRPRRRR